MQLMKAYMAETSYNQLSLTDSTTYERTHMLIKNNSLAQQSSKCQLYYVQFCIHVCGGGGGGVGGGLVLLTSLAAVLNTYSK